MKAADAPADADGSRDAWAEAIVRGLAKKWRVLVLMGNLHALKRLEWTSGQDHPYLAELLTTQGVGVLSMLQKWEGECTSRTASWFAADHPRAVAAVRSKLKVVAVHEPRDVGEVADGVVVWECVPGAERSPGD